MTVFALIFVLLAVPAANLSATDVFAPITLYQGEWRLTPAISGHGSDVISNQCHRYTEYFACQQSVNGKVKALVIYVYAGMAGHYKSQVVLPTGKSLGAVGNLLIERDHWTFSSNDVEGAKATWYRTTNDFHGKNQIHFEVAHSADGKNWIVDHKGDERRTSPR